MSRERLAPSIRKSKASRRSRSSGRYSRMVADTEVGLRMSPAIKYGATSRTAHPSSE